MLGMNEHNHQRLIVAWFRDRYPHLAGVFFAIPNGGYRDTVTAKRLKDEGVLEGVPDLMLAAPRNGFSGLFLEMKTLRGSASKAQRGTHEELRAQGYSVAIAKGYEAAKAVLTNYLDPTHA